MSTILVTGGTGFFGKAMLRYLVEREKQGHEVPSLMVLSRDPDRFVADNPTLAEHKWLQMVKGDICNPSTLPITTSFSHIVHAAADSTLGPQLSPLNRYDQIVDGTRNMLDLAVASGATRFLLTSSGGVYGPQPSDMNQIPEEYNGLPDPLNAQHAYSVAKRCAEHLCALYQERFGLQTVIARCFAFVGQDLPMDVHFAIGNFIRDALVNDEITVAGDGTAVRSYLDQRDLAEWLLTLLDRGEAGRAYNVGSDQAINIADLAHLVRDLVAPCKAVSIKGKADPNRPIHRYVPDITKAMEELRLGVTVPLPDAILAAADSNR